MIIGIWHLDGSLTGTCMSLASADATDWGVVTGELSHWGGTWLEHVTLISVMVAARLGGLVMALPMLFGGLPLRMRFLLVAAITLVLVPTVSGGTAMQDHLHGPIEIMMSACREILFGLIVGGVVQLLVSGIQLAGELIAAVSGMQLAQTADPASGETVPQFSQLLGVAVTAILFACGGHRMLIDALLTSFQQFPPMTIAMDQQLSDFVIDHLAIGIESGLRVAAPVVGCVLLTNLMVAVISRTAPQLNLLAIGLNINVMAALVVMALTIGSAGLVFESQLTGAIERLGLR